MAWAKLDDQLLNHPKFLAAGLDGQLLFMKSIVYCAQYLTDGFIPQAAIDSIMGVPYGSSLYFGDVDYLLHTVKIHPDAIPFLRVSPGYWAIGMDALSAWAGVYSGYPGLTRLGFQEFDDVLRGRLVVVCQLVDVIVKIAPRGLERE